MDSICYCNPSLYILLNDIKQNIRSLLRPNAVSLLNKGPMGQTCFVIYGNDPMMLDTYFDTLKVSGPLTNCSVFQYNIQDDNYKEHVESIRQLQKTKTVDNINYLIHIKRVNIQRSSMLHALIENIPDHTVIIISCHNLGFIDAFIRSRACAINISFLKENIKTFFETSESIAYDLSTFDTTYYESRGNIINMILRYLCGSLRFEEAFVTFLESCEKSRSFLACVMRVREMIYKVFHLNIPFSYICQLTIKHVGKKRYSGSKMSQKMQALAQLCAESEYRIHKSCKDLFVYEKFFLDLLDIIR